MKKYSFCILQNENPRESDSWIKSCKKYSELIDYSVVDLTKSEWFEEITNLKPDMLLVKPGGLTSSFKSLYDERLMILVKELGYKCYPTLDEVLIYENKKYFSYWLKSNNIPHPKTQVFYYMNEALQWLQKTDYPKVAKVNIGASGSGVSIINCFSEAKTYVIETFKGAGAKKRSGPNLQKSGLLKRGLKYVFKPSDIKYKLKIYNSKSKDVQRDFVIIQEYISHSFEWRVVRIGDSFFAHKKLLAGQMASGSLVKGYENPPLQLLDFVKSITDKFGFHSQAVDLFETPDGIYLINEMQCIFGQSDPYQMLVDNKPGRYIVKEEQWAFEEGDYASNQCYDLRVSYVINVLNKN